MLEGSTLILRAPEISDVDLLYDWENDRSLWYLSNTVAPFSRFTLEQYILNAGQDIHASKQLRLMIDKKDAPANKTIGSVDLFDFDPLNKRAGIGILIMKNERDKGNATEALEILLDYCFEVLHLHQVFCNIATDNLISLKLFRNFGFQEIGTKKDWVRIRDTWMDEVMLQKVKE
jgi:diamine N-acetyltransferase